MSKAYKMLEDLGFDVQQSRGYSGELCINLYHLEKKYVVSCIHRRGIKGRKDGFYYLVDFTMGNFIHIDIETHKAINLLMRELGWLDE